MSQALSEGDVVYCWSARRCYLKGPAVHLWDQQSYPGATRALIEDDNINEGHTFLRIAKWNRFFLASRIRVELNRRTGHCVFVFVVQIGLLAAGHLSRHPNRCPIMTADHHRWGRILVHRNRTGVISTGLMWYLLMSLGWASTKLVVLSFGFDNQLALAEKGSMAHLPDYQLHPDPGCWEKT